MAQVKLLTSKEAAAELGVTHQRVRQLISKGRLKATKFGNAWMIRFSDLEAVRVRKPGRPWHKEGDNAKASQ